MITYLETVDSTNTYAKLNNLTDGDIVYSLNQTDGRGRMGRVWQGKDCLALTLVHLPKDLKNVPVTSIIFGTAVCEALISLTNLPLKIKWPNDIIIDGKKLCGVLVEAVTDHNGITLMCGAGINLYNESFADPLADKAISLRLCGIDNIDIEKLISEILLRFNNYIKSGYLVPKSFSDLCLTLGKEITVIKGNDSFYGEAVGIATDGSLIVKKPDNTTINVNSGEVSIRGILGYV